MILRGASGLGDAVYMYPVLKYYLEHGQHIELLTRYNEIYAPLQKYKLILSDRYSKQPEVECRYSPRYPDPSTTTYEDTLFFAGIRENIPLAIEFEKKAIKKLESLKGHKICVVRTPALPMKGREDAKILIPKAEFTQAIITNMSKAGYAIVSVGSRNDFSGKPLANVDLDLTDQLDIRQLLTMVSLADCVVTQPSFLLPFAETLNKPCFLLFSGLAMRTPRKFYHQIVPKKIINKHEIVSWAVDDDGLAGGIMKLEEWRKKAC